jgi:hypothetical protein
MAAADSYLASFRPFTGFDSSRVISDTFTAALGAIPAANATIAAGLAGKAIDQLGGIRQQEMILEQRDKESESGKKSNRRQLALNLAQAFAGGGLFGGGGSGGGFIPLPGFDAANAVEMMFGLNERSRRDTQGATARTNATAAGVMNNLNGLTKVSG